MKQKPQEFPSFGNIAAMPKLIDLAEAARCSELSVARLIELADAGYLPHYQVDGGPPMFRRQELLAWVKDNLVQVHKGMPMPRHAVTLLDPETPAGKVPAALRGIDQLQPCVLAASISGVYFLCRDGTVVYVGQSTDVYRRVLDHRCSGIKGFNSAYFWPVPRPDLDRIEGAFIRLLKPRFNGNPGPATNDQTTKVCRALLDAAEELVHA